LNGALTIGTLDGANIEIRAEVGEQNFFLFGLDAAAVEARRAHYDPAAIAAADEDLRRVIDLLAGGHFNRGEPGVFEPILQALLSPSDPWLVLADFASYVAAQRRVAAAFWDSEEWTRMSILNTAASGRFSTDRTIEDYNAAIWCLEPLAVPAVAGPTSV
jgi:starch phosphorylase